MQVRELTALSRDELIEIINKQQAEMDAIGAGGVSLMGDARDAEIEKLRSLLKVTAAVGITMLYDSHNNDVAREFGLDELEHVVKATRHLAAQNVQVEHIYRQAWNAALNKQEQGK